MNNKFLDKVIYQIISETRVIDNKLYTPFLPYPSTPRHLSLYTLPYLSLSNHCKEVYSLNEQEIKYVWTKYLKEVTTLMDKKELSYE